MLNIQDHHNVWWTSDHHFNHNNVIKHSGRVPFMNCEELCVYQFGDEAAIRDLQISDATTRRMNDGLVDRWNSVVPVDGIVIYLGDLFWTDRESCQTILDSLNGRIHFVEGNHDDLARQMWGSNKSHIVSWNQILELRVKDEQIESGWQHIVNCHYAMRTWHRSHHGAYCLFGHSHGSLPDNPNSLSIDVGVDCHSYTPISYSQIKKIMSHKTYQPVDHHR